MTPDASLVINLSAGDVAYAYETAKALIESHRDSVKAVIIVIDTIKAPFSNFYNHSERYAEPLFSEKIKKVRETVDKLKTEGLVDQIISLKNGDPYIKNLSKKYFRNRIHETHDFRGAPITAYLVGLEACNTRYIVHYDGDILLHQVPGADWIIKGIQILETTGHLISISPNPAPPPATTSKEDYTDLQWFSTRCLLINKEILITQLPLVANGHRVELWLRKVFKRTYPPAFETILYKRLRQGKYLTRYLVGEPAWYIHPENKGEIFADLLEPIIQSIHNGDYPPQQTGNETLLIDDWKTYLQK